MSTFLSIVIGIQFLLGLIWTSVLASVADAGFGALYLFFVIYPIHAVLFLIGAIVYWRRPPLRKKALVIMVLPFVFLFLPGILKLVFGGPLTGERGLRAFVVVAGGLLAYAVVFPKKVMTILPERLFQSRAFNWLVIVSMALGWLLPVAGYLFLASQGGGSSGGGSSSGMGAAYVIVGAAMYIVAIGAGSLMTIVIGWLGIRGGLPDPPRKLHIAQIVMGAPGLVAGIVTLSWLSSQNL